MTSGWFFAAVGDCDPDTCWQPAVDVYRCRDGWLLKFDLAGVGPADVHVEIHGRRLRLHGVRRDLTIVEGATAYSMEIAYNRFHREIELPLDLADAAVEVASQEGMFLVTIRTREESR